MKSTLTVILILCAAPVVAETPMTAMNGAEFEAYVTDRTLTYGEQGQPPYGAERYLSDRRVIWSFLDGTCESGIWYEDAGNICFSYINVQEPVCWTFFRTETGALAVIDGGTTALYELTEAPESLICDGLGS